MLGVVNLSVGGITGTVVDPKIFFAVTVKSGACNIVLAHNHPSCGLIPSQEDIRLTKKIIQGGQFLDIKVLDHIILTRVSRRVG